MAGYGGKATVHSNFHDAVSQDESRRRKEKTECKAEAGTTETVHKSTWNDLPAQLPSTHAGFCHVCVTPGVCVRQALVAAHPQPLLWRKGMFG